MDIASITFPNGLALTSAKLDASFAAITGHVINRSDFGSSFLIAADLNMDGFGIENLRDINGTLAFADMARAAGLAVSLPELTTPDEPRSVRGLFNPLRRPAHGQGTGHEHGGSRGR